MTVATTGTRKRYTGNAATTSFSFPYHLQEKDDLKVYLDGVLKTLTTHYNISGTAPLPSGGNVVFTSAPGDGVIVLLERETDKTQDVNFSNLGNFDQESIETALDIATLIAQDVSGLMDDAILAPVSFEEGFRLPEPVQAELIAWEDADPPTALVNTGVTITEFTASVAAAAASAAAAQTAETNAELAEANAETAETNAELAEANAEAAEAAAEAAQAAAEAAAASASSIANGSLFAFVSQTGNFTAVNNGAYLVDDGAQITMPAIGANVNFRIAPKTSFTTGVTFLYTSNTINGYSEHVTVKTTEALAIYTPTATTWRIVRDFAPVINVVSSYASSTKTTDYTLTTNDDQINFNITAQSTLTTYAAATTTKPHFITNLETSTQKLVINPNGAETVNGASTFDVFPGQSFVLRSEGTNWRLY